MSLLTLESSLMLSVCVFYKVMWALTPGKVASTFDLCFYLIIHQINTLKTGYKVMAYKVEGDRKSGLSAEMDEQGTTEMDRSFGFFLPKEFFRSNEVLLAERHTFGRKYGRNKLYNLAEIDLFGRNWLFGRKYLFRPKLSF